MAITRQAGLIEQIDYVSRHNACIPDDRIGIQQERIARENRAAGVEEYLPPGNGFYVPLSVLNAKRELSVLAQGGAVVQDTVTEIGNFLYPASQVIRLGCTVIDGLTSNAQIPIGRAGINTSWTPETCPAVEQDPNIGSINLAPKLVSANVAISRQLLVQSAGFEEYLKKELALALGTELDRVAIFGSGSGSQPIGILNATGTQSVTFGAAATWPKLVQFEQLCGIANARPENLAWLIGNNTRAKWRTAVRGSTTGFVNYLLTDQNETAGYPVAVTSKLDAPSNQAIFGDFSECFIGVFGADALHLVVDPISQAKVGKVVIVANLYVDISIRRPNLFVISSDSAAQ